MASFGWRTDQGYYAKLTDLDGERLTISVIRSSKGFLVFSWSSGSTERAVGDRRRGRRK
jgi:hypothetical protein